MINSKYLDKNKMSVFGRRSDIIEIIHRRSKANLNFWNGSKTNLKWPFGSKSKIFVKLRNICLLKQFFVKLSLIKTSQNEFQTKFIFTKSKEILILFLFLLHERGGHFEHKL